MARRTTTPFGPNGERFDFMFFLVCLQCILNALFAFIGTALRQCFPCVRSSCLHCSPQPSSLLLLCVAVCAVLGFNRLWTKQAPKDKVPFTEVPFPREASRTHTPHTLFFDGGADAVRFYCGDGDLCASMRGSRLRTCWPCSAPTARSSSWTIRPRCVYLGHRDVDVPARICVSRLLRGTGHGALTLIGDR